MNRGTAKTVRHVIFGITVAVTRCTASPALADVAVNINGPTLTVTGDVGIQTTGAGTEVRVATSRIAAATTAAGTGTESCVFSNGSAFTALTSPCL